MPRYSDKELLDFMQRRKTSITYLHGHGWWDGFWHRENIRDASSELKDKLKRDKTDKILAAMRREDK